MSTLRFIFTMAAILLALADDCSIKAVQSYPTANLDSYNNKLESNDDVAEQGFRQFIHSSNPDSTVIGELKPNSSELDLLKLKNKIASTIMSMQAMEKASAMRSKLEEQTVSGADCYVEVTRVEKVPGKCHKVNNGLPICQAENYMAINYGCS